MPATGLKLLRDIGVMEMAPTSIKTVKCQELLSHMLSERCADRRAEKLGWLQRTCTVQHSASIVIARDSCVVYCNQCTLLHEKLRYKQYD